MTPGPHPGSPEAEPGGGLVSAAAFPTSAEEAFTFRVGISSGSEPARGKKPGSRSVLSPQRENWDAHGGQGGSSGRRAPFRDPPLGTTFRICKVRVSEWL